MSALILVVDDLLPNRKLLEAKLKGEYYNVMTAEGGIQALEIVKETPPDVILLDVMMPDMDGFETCRAIKSNPKTADIPIVMVTALSELKDRIEGLNAGADDFLTKPINDLALFARIRSLVRLKSMTDELKLRDVTADHMNERLAPDKINDISGSKIMIVDDDEIQAQQIHHKLNELKIEVDVVNEPQVAVKMTETKSFDMIMVSTQMAAADGLHLCTHLRSQEKTRNTPLLIIVEDDNTDLLIKALDMGINDYLITPIESSEVIARVKIQVRRKKYQDELTATRDENLEMAIRDGLTNLYNRRYFDSHIQVMLKDSLTTGKPMALVMVDMDHFKQVNDTYGHQSGDDILKELAKRIMDNVRPTDLVARYGGEEFVIIMPDTSLKNAAEVADRVRKIVEAKEFAISAPPHKINKTISLGLSIAKNDDTIEKLINRADKALYHVKNTGRNKVAVYNK